MSSASSASSASSSASSASDHQKHNQQQLHFDEVAPQNKVYLSKSKNANPACGNIAIASKMDYEQLFYNHFVDENLLKSWVENDCHKSFFEVFVADPALKVDATMTKSPLSPPATITATIDPPPQTTPQTTPQTNSQTTPQTHPPEDPEKPFDPSSLIHNHVIDEVVDFNHPKSPPVIFNPTFKMNPESNTGLYWSDESVDIHQLHDTRRNNQQDENDLPNTMVKIADLQADPAVHLTTDGNCPDGPKESHACCKVADPVGVWQQKVIEQSEQQAHYNTNPVARRRETLSLLFARVSPQGEFQKKISTRTSWHCSFTFFHPSFARTTATWTI